VIRAIQPVFLQELRVTRDESERSPGTLERFDRL
jgi:hypothetical protein